jgi:hypothetical protein
MRTSLYGPGTRRQIVRLLAAAAFAIPAARASAAPHGKDGGPHAATVKQVPNSVDTIISDMREMNDLPLAGIPENYGWAKGPGHVTMGNQARGTGTPSWWKPTNLRFKSSDYWNAIIPWFVIFDGQGNRAINTRVEVRNLRLYSLSRKSGLWMQVASSAEVEGALYPKHLTGSVTHKPDLRALKGVSTAIRPPGGDLVFHGWCCGRQQIDGSDVEAIFVTVQARLTPDRPTLPPDIDTARYLLHVGADYYPDSETLVSAFAPTGYNPGVGLGRAKLVKPEWQAFNFATIAAGVLDNPRAVISIEAFRRNPPPLE